MTDNINEEIDEVSDVSEESANNNEDRKGNSLLIFGIVLALVVVGVVLFAKNSKTDNPGVAGNSIEVTPVNETSTSETVDSENNSVLSSDTESQNEAIVDESGAVTVEGGMFYYKPNIIRVKKGTPVKITFNNVEGTHDFVIDEFEIQSKEIGSGETDTIEFTPDSTGSFEFYCSVGNHRQMGMKGTLIVEE